MSPKLSSLKQGKHYAIVGRLLEDPHSIEFRGKRVASVLLGDSSGVVELVGWKELADALSGFKRGQAIKADVSFPPSLGGKPILKLLSPPALLSSFNSFEGCVKPVPLCEAPKSVMFFAEGFVTSVHAISLYYCRACGRSSLARICVCGEEAEPKPSVKGNFSDGTLTLRFSTTCPDAALAMAHASNVEEVTEERLMGHLQFVLAHRWANVLRIEAAYEGPLPLL